MHTIWLVTSLRYRRIIIMIYVSLGFSFFLFLEPYLGQMAFWGILFAIGIEFSKALYQSKKTQGCFRVIASKPYFYWKKERWLEYQTSLFLPGLLLLHLQSLRNGKRIALLLFSDQTDRTSWRILCYICRQRHFN